MHAAAALLALALSAELPPSIVPEAPAPAPAAPVEAPASPAPATAPAPPWRAEPAEPEPARALAPEVLESIGDAAVAYSWSGPLKWAAISSAGTGIALVAANKEGDANTTGKILIAAGAVQLGVALLIDMSARSSLAEAGHVRAHRPPASHEEDDEEDGEKPTARRAPRPSDDYEDDYDL